MEGDGLERVANGYYTRMLGERLESLSENEFKERYRVYYDHKVSDPDRILAQVGKGNQTEDMAHLDVAIVDTTDDKEHLLVVSEIEEHKHAPKRLLGDVAAIMMSEKVKIDGRDHPLMNADIVLGVVTKKGGQTGPKAMKYITRFELAMGEGPGGRRGLRCFLFYAEDGSQLVDKIEDFVGSLLRERP
jgi:hypothetical protein